MTAGAREKPGSDHAKRAVTQGKQRDPATGPVDERLAAVPVAGPRTDRNLCHSSVR